MKRTGAYNIRPLSWFIAAYFALCFVIGGDWEFFALCFGWSTLIIWKTPRTNHTYVVSYEYIWSPPVGCRIRSSRKGCDTCSCDKGGPW